MVPSLEDIPSWKTLLTSAFLGSQIPFLGSPGQEDRAVSVNRPSTVSQTCPKPGLSCQKGYGALVDTCCINSPGGLFALTQFWNSDAHAGPPGYLGPNTTWTIHGLWPDHCDGTFDSVCDCNRSGDCSSYNHKCSAYSCNQAYSSITNILENHKANDLLSNLTTYWKGIAGDEHLWQHEWSKHGTCVSTLDPKCYGDAYSETQEVVDYFQTALDLWRTLPSYDWLAAAGITPSHEQTYFRKDIEEALSNPRDGKKAIIQCQHGELREIWYHFLVRGSLQHGEFVPVDPGFWDESRSPPPSSCPETGIKYLPKGSNAPSPTATSAPTGTAVPKPGSKARLVVNVNGAQRGCLISNGKWYNTLIGSSCASFKAQKDDDASSANDSITLRSSRGPCGIRNGAFTCGNNMQAAKFVIVDGKLVFADNSSGVEDRHWSAERIPRGIQQQPVLASDRGGVSLDIIWRIA